MADVRWICMSDMHFGAENSILSHIPERSTTVEPETPSPVLVELAACLRAVVETNSGDRPPILILHGDILELALADDNVAAMSFAAFIKLAFATDRPLFDDQIYYIPGNHDHHLWETARELQYAHYIATLAPEEPIKAPWHVTRLFEEWHTATPQAELLNALLRRHASRDLSVKVVYPNCGIESQDRERLIVIHHGQFTEPLYRLVSSLKGALFPGQPSSEEVWDWESDNFAWIDFFWSTLGRSGAAGADVGLIYDMLQDKTAVGSLAANLARFAAGHLHSPLRAPARIGITPLARWLVPKVAYRERSIPTSVLSAKTVNGLREYLSGPLRLQMERERRGSSDRELTFIFGHTHKPFEDTAAVSGFARPVSLVNSGGWVVDTRHSVAVQGASVVLIDADLGVAPLRMYNQSDDPSSYAVRLAERDSLRDRALEARLRGSLRLGRPPWTTFSEEAARAVATRHRLLPQLVQRGVELTEAQRWPFRARGRRSGAGGATGWPTGTGPP